MLLLNQYSLSTCTPQGYHPFWLNDTRYGLTFKYKICSVDYSKRSTEAAALANFTSDKSIVNGSVLKCNLLITFPIKLSDLLREASSFIQNFKGAFSIFDIGMPSQ